MACDTRVEKFANGQVGHTLKSCSQSGGRRLVFEGNRGLEQEDRHLHGDFFVKAGFDIVQQGSDECPGFLHPPELSKTYGTRRSHVHEERHRPVGRARLAGQPCSSKALSQISARPRHSAGGIVAEHWSHIAPRQAPLARQRVRRAD